MPAFLSRYNPIRSRQAVTPRGLRRRGAPKLIGHACSPQTVRHLVFSSARFLCGACVDRGRALTVAPTTYGAALSAHPAT